MIGEPDRGCREGALPLGRLVMYAKNVEDTPEFYETHFGVKAMRRGWSAPSCSNRTTSGAVQRRYMSLETLAPISDVPNVSLPAMAA